MKDTTILENINQLVEEERRLRAESPAAGEHSERLVQIEEQLDQCWDLLRQRRARREFGENPDDAQPRDVETVERYLN